MTIREKNKKKIEKAWVLANGKIRCHWCKRRVYITEHVINKPIEDNRATIDHIYPKGDIRRDLVGYDESTVISCFSCNQKRNEEFVIREEKWQPYIIGLLRTPNYLPISLFYEI